MFKFLAIFPLIISATFAADVAVRDTEALARALREAKPGTVIRLAPGRYVVRAEGCDDVPVELREGGDEHVRVVAR